jgi:hypothetical protein
MSVYSVRTLLPRCKFVPPLLRAVSPRTDLARANVYDALEVKQDAPSWKFCCYFGTRLMT